MRGHTGAQPRGYKAVRYKAAPLQGRALQSSAPRATRQDGGTDAPRHCKAARYKADRASYQDARPRGTKLRAAKS